MKVPKRTALLAAVSALLLILAVAGSTLLRARHALRHAQEAVAAEDDLKFIARPYLPTADVGFEWVGTSETFAQAAEYDGHLYIAGQSGLFEYDDRGHELRQFRVGRELPSSPLLRIARGTLADSRQPELIIATADAGLLAFDGAHFRQIVPQDRDARSVTSIMPLEVGRLLIGTAQRGVLVFDGRRLRPLHASLNGIHVTELAGSDTDLWIGTQDRGVGHFHGGATEWFSESDGLPDMCVYAIAVDGDRTFVGTSNGIAEFIDGKFSRKLAAGSFVRSLLAQGDTLLAGTMDDGILEIPLVQSSRTLRHGIPSGQVPEAAQLLPSADAVYAVTRAGVFIRNGAGSWKQALQPDAGLLTDANVSALAADPEGRLWVGYFDRGLDIVENFDQQQRRRTRHIEDDRLFCINRILLHARADANAVATANGLVLFDDQGIRRQVLTQAEGLIADHVTDVVPYGDGMAIATPAGITFLDSAGTRSIYAFHGLVNNHVYALAADGNHLLAGTLGGATMLDGDQVRASYTTATSSLKHNWITAAVRAGDESWIGTYGAGVMRMSDKEAGRFDAADGASGNLIVNPGAMLVTDRLVLAGTMGSGVYVMDRNSETWAAVTAGLPSLNVTALTHANGYIYVGTDNGLVRIAEGRLAQ